jgi:FKBP-type peptidyl-prolyl cis-trans isomerase
VNRQSRRFSLWLVLLVAGSLLGCEGTTGPDGLTTVEVVDLTAGTGAEATNGKALSVYYIGWLWDKNAPENKGTQFDARVQGDPFTFVLGAGTVIRGWDLGLPGLRVGGRRKLTVPPELGYGSKGNGPVPGNATLIFEVELREVN